VSAASCVLSQKTSNDVAASWAGRMTAEETRHSNVGRAIRPLRKALPQRARHILSCAAGTSNDAVARKVHEAADRQALARWFRRPAAGRTGCWMSSDQACRGDQQREGEALIARRAIPRRGTAHTEAPRTPPGGHSLPSAFAAPTSCGPR
jgi:hypothetical protein